MGASTAMRASASIARGRPVPTTPPIGSRDFTFFVGVEDRAIEQVRVVGSDPFDPSEDDWPPPSCIRDAISGQYRVYHRGTMRPSTVEEAAHLETAAVWGLTHLRARLDRGE